MSRTGRARRRGLSGVFRLAAAAAVLTPAAVWAQAPDRATPRPMGDRVPARSLAFFSHRGYGRVPAGTAMGKLIGDAGLARWIDEAAKAAIGSLPEGSEQKIARAYYAIYASAFRNPTCFAWVEMPKEGKELPGIVEIVELGDEAKSIGKAVDEMAGPFLRHGFVTRRIVRGHALYRFGEDDAMTLGVVDKSLYIVFEDELAEEVVGLDAAESLGGNPAFLERIKPVSTGEPLQVGYVAVDRIRDAINAYLGGDPQVPGGIHPQLEAVLAGLGLEETTGIAMTSSAADEHIRTRVRIDSPGPHRGVLSLLGGEALPADALRNVPADAIFASAARLSPWRLLVEAERILRGIPDNPLPRMDELLLEASEATGVSLVNDVYRNLGDVWVVASAPSLGGYLTGTVAWVDVERPEKLWDALEKLVAAMASGDAPLSAELKTYRRGGLSVRYLRIHTDSGREPIPVQPSWAIHKGRLYVAAYPQAIVAATQKPEASLPDDERYRHLWSLLEAEEASIVAYSNLAPLLRDGYGGLMALWSAGVNAGASEEMDFLAEWMPPLGRIQPHVLPSMTVVTPDEAGITIRAAGTTPATGVKLALSLALPTSTALTPTIPLLRSAAQRKASMTRAKQLTQAIHMSSITTGDGASAPDLEALVEADLVTTDMLVTGRSGRKPPVLEDGKLVGEVDFVYLRPERLDQAGSDDIVLYERLENWQGKGTVVAFIDGSVRWMEAEELKKALAEQTGGRAGK